MITREEFVREVQKFKSKHGKKLKELLNENSCCMLCVTSLPDLSTAKKALGDFNSGYILVKMNDLRVMFYVNKHQNALIQLEVNEKAVINFELSIKYGERKKLENSDLYNIRSKTGHVHEPALEKTTREFFQNPIIRGYLARDANQVAFSDSHPDLRDSKTKIEHEFTDHYELKVYKYLEKMIAYRNSIDTKEFYHQGADGRFIASLLVPLNKVSPDIVSCGQSWIYFKHCKSDEFTPIYCDSNRPNLSTLLNFS